MGSLFDNLALQIIALSVMSYAGLWLIGLSVVLRLALGFGDNRPTIGIWHSRAFFLIGILILIFGVIPLARALMA
jgi:hypothetical protein